MAGRLPRPARHLPTPLPHRIYTDPCRGGGPGGVPLRRPGPGAPRGLAAAAGGVEVGERRAARLLPHRWQARRLGRSRGVGDGKDVEGFGKGVKEGGQVEEFWDEHERVAIGERMQHEK